MTSVPDPHVVAQLPGSPVSVRLSTVASMDGDQAAIFYIVMSDAHGKILGRHPILSFDEVVTVAANLATDAAKVWSAQAAESERRIAPDKEEVEP